MADPPDVDEAPLPLPGAAVEAEPGRTAERRVCGRCRYSVPLGKWPRHEEHCAAFFVRPSAAEQLVQRHGALPFLRRFLRVPQLSFSALQARSATLVPDCFQAAGLVPPTALQADLPPGLVQAMGRAAQEGQVRAEGNEAKHWPQEIAICAAIRGWLMEQLPDLVGSSPLQLSEEDGPVDLRDSVCVIELGAGGGELAHLLQCVARTALVLVDYYPPPRMVDPLYAGRPDFARIWKRIEDVTAEDLRPYLRRVNVVVAKHLCGAGFDAALHQVGQWGAAVPLHLLAMAPCCQHGSRWETYAGREWWQRQGFTEADFVLATQKMNWKDAKNRALDTRRILYHIGSLFEAVHAQGRKAWLQGQGYSVDLLYYIDDGATMRNVLFLAGRPVSEPPDQEPQPPAADPSAAEPPDSTGL
eukprot:EG_transcript_13881